MLSKKSSKVINILFISVLSFFALIIFLPSIYILKYSFSGLNIFAHPEAYDALNGSFLIGFIVTLLNIIFGIPLAWVLVRYKNWFTKIIDNLIDLSLVMPTAALGLSIYLYWGKANVIWELFGFENGLISRGMIMIILLHIVFTLPYMIRSVAAVIEQLESQFEEAAITLGASPFTFFSTIAVPLFKDGIINGSILSFTRSLSETGATMMVAGVFATAPVLIINLKNMNELPAAAGVSIILIISAVLILFLAKLFLGHQKLKLSVSYPKVENRISKLAPLKNIIIFSFFIIFIFLPTIQIVFYGLSNFAVPPGMIVFLKSLFLSLNLALAATFINFLFSVPFSYIIARNIYGIGNIMDTLSEVILLVPTGALGLSLSIFWHLFISDDFLILLLVHMSFTFPLLVKPITSAIKAIPPSEEEASYSLGVSVEKTFTSIILPQIKPAVIAGCIMAFMRSLSETGATLAVSKNIKTATILIVDIFKNERLPEAAFACSILFIITFILLFILKKTSGKYVNRGDTC